MNKPNESKIQLKHELDNSIRDIAEKVKNLNDYNTELKTENNDLKLTLKSNDKKLNEIDETHKIQVIQLEKTNMKLTCNLTMLKEENKKLKTDLDNLLKARHRHRQEIDNIIKEKNMIQTALNEMTANNVKLESAITQLESERKALNSFNARLAQNKEQIKRECENAMSLFNDEQKKRKNLENFLLDIEIASKKIRNKSQDEDVECMEEIISY